MRAGAYDARREFGYDLNLPGGLTAEQAVRLYEESLEEAFAIAGDDTEHPDDRAAAQAVVDAVLALRGCDLACYCDLMAEWCHADVVLRLANGL